MLDSDPGPQAIQSVGGHLVSLYAQLERGESIAYASAVVERGIRRKGFFHWLRPPSFAEALTVVDVQQRLDDPPRAARDWVQSVWAAWSAHHGQVRTWHEALARLR